MPKNQPSIVLSSSESSVTILYGGFDTSADPVTVERRAAGAAAWTVVATPSDGDGEVVDDGVVAGVTYEYRATAGDATAVAEVSVGEPVKARKPRSKPEPKAEAPKPPMQTMLMDPWGLLGDISEADPYAVIVIPSQGK